jgi:deazaflavin-dependent oxidoreductase (nitroreductase family)
VLPKIFKYAGKAHVWVYRRTGGRIGGKWRIGAGFRKPVPTLLLEHRGRQAGKVFVTPLLYMLDGANVVIVGSQGGRADGPQCYRNLLASPGTHIEVGAGRRAVHAATAPPTSGPGCGRTWWTSTRTSTTTRPGQTREIPMVVLRPR